MIRNKRNDQVSMLNQAKLIDWTGADQNLLSHTGITIHSHSLQQFCHDPVQA